MEIIKNGKPRKSKKLFKCENCGCVFKASDEEYHTSAECFAWIKILSFDCKSPCCGMTVYFKAERESNAAY